MIRRPPPPHRATTASLQAAYPFAASSPPLHRGVYIGRDVYGGAFLYDPFLAYEAGLVGSPNMLVIGQLGHGKSSLVKSYCWRQLVFGRRISVMDVKGEYQRLAEAAGGSVIRLDPASRTRVNPLDTARAGVGGEQQQLTLVVALAEAALGRDLTPPEHAGCAEALHSARRDHGPTPTLPQVVDGLLRPHATAAERLATTAEGMASECRHVALALRRMVAGDLAGLFDGPTTLDVDLDAPVVVIDLSAVASSSALAVVLTCAAAWLDAQLRRRRGGKRLVVNDEAWRVIAEPGIARWLQSSWKLARSYGVQHIGMLHRLSDLESAGEAGSEQVRAVHGLLADVETRVAYCQPARPSARGSCWACRTPRPTCCRPCRSSGGCGGSASAATSSTTTSLPERSI